MTTRRHRRAIAIVACALWLLGVEALPGLHLGAHRDDHTHERDGLIVRRGEHRHGTVVHAHAHAKPEKRRKQPQLAFDVARFSHDAGGLAHHATAYTPAEPPVIAPLPVDRPTLGHARRVDQIIVGIGLDRAHARGPPA